MNWKKLIFGIVGGAFAGSLGHYASELHNGHPIAFTFGNIMWPALSTIITTVAALFVKPPTQQ